MTEELERKAEQFAEEHAFRVPYDGSNKFYDDTDYKASKDGYIAGATEATKELQEKITRLEGEREDFLYNWYCDNKGGCKAEELENWKSEWQEQVQKANDEGYARTLLQIENGKLKEQIEKMRNCRNCKYGYCGGSSISIDKNGNITFHNWNKEKQEYCDVGKNGKYQCWELAE